MPQQGFEYETNTYNSLKKYGISTGEVAGAAKDKPDLTVISKGETSGVELKNKPTSAGSLVLQYYDNQWHFGPTDNNPEKEFLEEVGKKVKIIDFLNKNWKDPALRYNGKKKYYKPPFKNYAEAYRYDLKKFKDIYIDVPNSTISNYYKKKNTPYLNIGNKGFFIFNGNNDPLSLQKRARTHKLPIIPIFSNQQSATTKVRVRVQYKSGGYQFSFTLQFSKVLPSPYNIGPLKIGSNSSINEEELKNNPILLLFKG